MSARTTILKTLALSLLVFSPTAPEGFGQDDSAELSLSSPRDLVLDAQGNILVVDHNSYQVFKVTRDGKISLFAGTGKQRQHMDSGGDGGPATEAQLRSPKSIAAGAHNDVYISDRDRIRRVDSGGIITTVAGGGESDGSIPHGQLATDFSLFEPDAIAFDSGSGRLYIGQTDERIWRVENGRIFHHAGTGESGCRGNGQHPTAAQFDFISDMAVGPDGSLYLADRNNRSIRKIDPAGTTITAAAGNGTGWNGTIPDGTPALRTGMRLVSALTFDSRGRLHFINDIGAIYRLESNGTLSLFTRLSDLLGRSVSGRMIFDPSGNLIIVDRGSPQILEVSADGSRVRIIAGGSNSRSSQGISDISAVAYPEYPSNKSTSRDAHSIIGGEEVSPGEWPFVVRVDAPTSFCTGSLVAPNWILTAAHCLVDDDGQVDDASDISVFLGYDRDKGVCENTRAAIGRVIVHPDFDHRPASSIPDAALIEILEPAPADPVRILTPEEETWHAPGGTLATVIGGGRHEGGYLPRVLRHVSLPLISTEDCRKNSLWEQWQSGIINERALCAGGVEGKMIWYGDSGGPFVVPLPMGGWGQVGIGNLGPGGLSEALVGRFQYNVAIRHRSIIP